MSDRGRRSFLRIRRPQKGEASDPGATEETPGEGHSPDFHTRVVVPREERSGRPSQLDVELREVRYGRTAKTPYLRVVPKQRRLTRVGTGYIEATRLASRPRGVVERVLASTREVLLGGPFATAQLVHERLSKVKALAIFSSDALSSSAYATEEILRVLILAGAGALHYSLPIGAVIALLLGIVTLSYRQTIKAYPTGEAHMWLRTKTLAECLGSRPQAR